MREIPLISVLAVVVVSFVLATVLMELRESRIDRDADGIAANALPSVEHLAAARLALGRVEVRTWEYAAAVAAGGPAALDVATSRDEVRREFAAELETPNYAGETDAAQSVRTSLDELDGWLAKLASADAGERIDRNGLRRAFAHADAALQSLEEINLEGGRMEIRRISSIRATSLGVTLALNLACLALTAAVAVAAARATRQRRELQDAYRTLIETRAAELERFASRVAHDLLSPLSSLHFTLGTAQRNADKGLPLEAPIERARASLKRAQALVEGVLDFARAGAVPGVGRAGLLPTLQGVFDDVRAESPDVEFIADGVAPDTKVACSSGVLGSILSNLVRNAVKFMDDGGEKRVTVRAAPAGAMVRVEVEDTGPGLPEGLEQHVFEPYVRAAGVDRPGLGLGLATVARFVESHLGRVGVSSSRGHGSLFWFELPRAHDVTER